MIIVTIVIADVLDYFLNPLAGEMGIKHSSIQKYAASLTSLISVVGMYEIFYLFRQLNKSELQKEQLKRENVSSQLESLKNQVNPHFLFNSLNTLATIITEDEKLAVKFVENMSKVYRSILEMKDRTIVSLEEEWAFTQNYIFLLKTRFEDALEFQVNLEAKTENYAIVPISLQLLIENAIKHNIVSRSQKLIIQLDIDNDYLVVSNKLQPRTEVINSTNTGLKNINNRVKLVTNKEIVIIQTETEFKVRIPLMNIQSYESTDH
jgi:LytS/YehU family sensor histidine kinase